MSAPTITQPLRVIRLEAENFKRIVAVDLRPDPDAPTVTVADLIALLNCGERP